MSTASNLSHIHPHAAKGFSDTKTDQYESGRPDYAIQCVQLLVSKTLPNLNNQERQGQGQEEGETLQIMDLGCGTGKFTRPLVNFLASENCLSDPSVSPKVSKKVKIFAVDPVKGMINKFNSIYFAQNPNSLNTNIQVESLIASGEFLPFEKESLHAIYVAQAFHWFANVTAVKEMARVLKPKGGIGLIWNTRDTRIAWVEELEKIIDEYYGPDVPRQKSKLWQQPFRHPDVAELFEVTEAPASLSINHQSQEDTHSSRVEVISSKIFENLMVQRGGVDLILDRVLSISSIACLEPDRLEEVAKRVKSLLSSHPQTKGLTSFSLPYITECYWITKK